MLFAKKTNFKFGLDIGSSAIKIIKLSEHDNIRRIEDFSISDNPREKAGLAVLLKNFLNDVGVASYPIHTALSGQNVITRYVSLPAMADDDFRKALRFEAQKYIPFAIEEVEYDGYILKRDLPGNKMSVLIAAAKKDLVHQRINLLKDLGFRLAVVEIDSLALVNLFNFNYAQNEELKNKTTALLNIGATITNLNILERGIPCLSRDIHIAGDNFTTKISDIFGVDSKNAERLKKNLDEEKIGKAKSAIEPILSQLIQEIRTSFDYYESQSVLNVEKIFLIGGGSLFPEIKENLNHHLGIEIDIWDPLINFALAETLDNAKIKADSSQLAVAIGLAMRE